MYKTVEMCPLTFKLVIITFMSRLPNEATYTVVVDTTWFFYQTRSLNPDYTPPLCRVCLML